jgi:hypothetical protein
MEKEDRFKNKISARTIFQGKKIPLRIVDEEEVIERFGGCLPVVPSQPKVLNQNKEATLWTKVQNKMFTIKITRKG